MMQVDLGRTHPARLPLRCRIDLSSFD
jgi:hypothetical protein